MMGPAFAVDPIVRMHFAEIETNRRTLSSDYPFCDRPDIILGDPQNLSGFTQLIVHADEHLGRMCIRTEMEHTAAFLRCSQKTQIAVGEAVFIQRCTVTVKAGVDLDADFFLGCHREQLV